MLVRSLHSPAVHVLSRILMLAFSRLLPYSPHLVSALPAFSLLSISTPCCLFISTSLHPFLPLQFSPYLSLPLSVSLHSCRSFLPYLPFHPYLSSRLACLFTPASFNLFLPFHLCLFSSLSALSSLPLFTLVGFFTSARFFTPSFFTFSCFFIPTSLHLFLPFTPASFSPFQPLHPYLPSPLPSFSPLPAFHSYISSLFPAFSLLPLFTPSCLSLLPLFTPAWLHNSTSLHPFMTFHPFHSSPLPLFTSAGLHLCRFSLLPVYSTSMLVFTLPVLAHAEFTPSPCLPVVCLRPCLSSPLSPVSLSSALPVLVCLYDIKIGMYSSLPVSYHD